MPANRALSLGNMAGVVRISPRSVIASSRPGPVCRLRSFAVAGPAPFQRHAGPSPLPPWDRESSLKIRSCRPDAPAWPHGEACSPAELSVFRYRRGPLVKGISGWRRTVPVEEQGASSNTASNVVSGCQCRQLTSMQSASRRKASEVFTEALQPVARQVDCRHPGARHNQLRCLPRRGRRTGRRQSRPADRRRAAPVSMLRRPVPTRRPRHIRAVPKPVHSARPA